MALLGDKRRNLLGLALAAALLAALASGVRAAGLADSTWPMFHHDPAHTGRSTIAAPSIPQMRWWQGAGGPVFASPIVSAEHAIRKVWYLHSEAWRLPTPPAPPVYELLSLAPDTDMVERSVLVSSAADELAAAFETSSAVTSLPSYRGRWDPFRRQIPAGRWRFVFWGHLTQSDPPQPDAVTRVYFKVYRFPENAGDSGTLLFTTPLGASRRISIDPTQYVTEFEAPAYDLDYTDGIRVELWVRTTAANPLQLNLNIEGETRSRVETPIWEKCVLGGSDDGQLYAMDAGTGNIFWTVRPATGRMRGTAAIDENGVTYIGTEEDTDLSSVYSNGCLYAIKPDGSIKWIFPSYRPKFYLRSGQGTVDSTALMDHIFASGAGNYDSGCQPGDDITNYYQIQPRAENAGGTAGLPPGVTQWGWIGEKDWSNRRLIAGEWVLNLALRITNCGATLPQGYLYYRISKVKFTGAVGAEQIERVAELLGWTRSQLLRPAVEFNPAAPDATTLFAELRTPEVLPTTFATGEYPYVEFALRQTVPSVSGAGWHLLVDTQDSTVLVGGLNAGQIRAINNAPAISEDGTIIFATLGGTVYALEEDGTERWSRDLLTQEEVRSSPALSPATTVSRTIATAVRSGDVVTVLTTAAHGFKVGAQVTIAGVTPAGATSFNGVFLIAAVPSTTTFQYAQTAAADTGTGGTASISVWYHGRVYIGGMDGILYALDGNSGEILRGASYPNWPVTLNIPPPDPLPPGYNPNDDITPIESSPAVDDHGRVFVCVDKSNDGQHTGRIVAVDGDSGALLWTYSPPVLPTEAPASMTTTPAISADGQVVYAGSDNGRLYALPTSPANPLAPVELWTFPGDGSNVGAVRSSPALAPWRAADQVYLDSDGNLVFAKPAVGLSSTIVTGTGYDPQPNQPEHCLLFREPAGALHPLPATPAAGNGWEEGIDRGGQTILTGAWQMHLYFRKMATATVTQQGYLWYRFSKRNSGTGAFTIIHAGAGRADGWIRCDRLLDDLDTDVHALGFVTPNLPAVAFQPNERLFLEIALQQTAGAADPTDGWQLGLGGAAPDDYLQTPQVESGEHIYFGAGNGYVYCLNPNGNLRWAWMPDRGGVQGAPIFSSPAMTNVADEPTLFLRTLAGTAAGTAQLTTSSPPATAVANWDTVAIAGAAQSEPGSPDFLQFLPVTTNPGPTVSQLPAALTSSGWIAEANLAGRVWAAGKWRFSIMYAVNVVDPANKPTANLWYRLSKVRLDTGVPVSAGTLVNWTEHTSELAPPALDAQRLVLDTASVPQVSWGAGEYPYLELALEPTSGGPPGLSWALQLDTVYDYLRGTGAGEESVLYLGDLDWNYYALGAVGPSGLVPGTITLPALPSTGPALLHMTKTASKSVGATGDTLTYSIRLRNDAVPGLTTVADNIQISDPVPPEMAYVVGSGGNLVGSVVVFDSTTDPRLASLQPGDTYRVQWTGTITQVVSPPSGTTVTVHDSDPLQPPAGTSLDHLKWGQALFLDVKNRGVPVPITNLATATANSGITGRSNQVRTEIGYGHRYRLTFIYTPQMNSNPGSPAPPVNQPVTISTVVELNGAGEYQGRQEEAVEAGDLGETVFKLDLTPRGYPYSPNAVSMTEPPNRPWTPYHWQVVVQQITGETGASHAWTDPPWGTGAGANVRDFSLDNPLALVQPAGAVTSKLGLHAGSATDAWGYHPAAVTPAFILQNTSMFSMTATSSTRPTNAVRWDAPSLLADPVLVVDPAYYNAYDENSVPAWGFHFLPRYDNASRGTMVGAYAWADLPRYLSPGSYHTATEAAPGARLPGFLTLYADLSGNESWDPAEMFYEYFQLDNNHRFPVLAGAILAEPLIASRESVLDLSRQPHGAPVPGRLHLRNEGNVGLADGTVSLSLSNPVQRADLPSLALWPTEQALPLEWTMLQSLGALAKTPVGWWGEPAHSRLLLDPPAALEQGQPVGHYLGQVALAATYPTINSAVGLPLKATVGERRVLQNFAMPPAPVVVSPGMDIYPFAYWSDDDHLQVYWSSNAPPDANLYLYHNTLDRAAGTWGTDTRIPAPTDTDPLDLPTAAAGKRHLTPVVGRDAAGRDWLFWAGAGVRPGGAARYDHRLLWRDLTTGTTTWAPDPAANPSARSGSLRLSPAPLGWRASAVSADNLKMVNHDLLSCFSEETGDRWHLVVNYWRSQQTRPSGGSDWGAETAPKSYQETNLSLGRDLISAQHSTPVPAMPRTYYLRAEPAAGDPAARQLDTWPASTIAETPLTVPVSTEPVRVAGFLTARGEPAVTSIPAGPWWLQVKARAANAAAGARLTFRVYAFNDKTGPPATLLFPQPADPVYFSDALPDTETLAQVAWPQPQLALPEGGYDRLYVEVWAQALGSTQVTLYCGGGSGSRLVPPLPDSLANVVFTGRSQLHGNNDLYWARFDLTRAGDQASAGLCSFPHIYEAPTPLQGSMVYATRHQRWLGEIQLWDGTGQIYSGAFADAPFDPATGNYTLVAGTRRILVNPDSGRIEFVAQAPTGQVAVYYAPRLLRLTEHPGNDLTPAAFVETYRYQDGTGASQPAGFRPRLWVFWARGGGPGLGASLYWKTYRLASHLFAPTWEPEQRQNNLDQRWDVGEDLVPLDQVANEFGISACKDPRSGQVWLFWSSTRGKPPAGAGQYNTDLYYETFAPPLPD